MKKFLFKSWKYCILVYDLMSTWILLLAFIGKRRLNFYKIEKGILDGVGIGDCVISAFWVVVFSILYVVNFRVLQKENPHYGKKHFWIGFGPLLLVLAVEFWLSVFYNGY